MSQKSQDYMKNYENFLEKRVSLLTKTFDPMVPVKKQRRPSPNEVKLRVLQSQRFNNYLDKISLNKADRQKKVFETLQILSEIAFNRNLLVVRSLGTIIDKLMAQLYKAVFINEESIITLKSSMGNQQIIYLPSHRSYVDFMLMSYVCFNYNLEIPAIAAGMDFHNMLGLGELLRKTGAFFMRRTFGDEFYWNIFKDYMHEVITFNDFGLEFFIEGTRSRTCKALWPKIGLLSMALEPYFMGEIYDLKIVPISISYEKPLEEQLFVYELLGIPKPKETTKGFLKAVTNLKDKNYGNMYFDFCEPISLNEYFGDKVDKFRHSSEPAYIQKLSNDELDLTNDLAHRVVQQQQNKIVIMTFNLISLIYNYHVFTNTVESLTMAELKKEIVQMMKLFESLGAIVSVNPQNLTKDIYETLGVHNNILEIHQTNIRLIKSNVQIAKNTDGMKLKGRLLSKECMDIAIPVFSLQLYCNPSLFWLCQPAFSVLSLIGEGNIALDQLKKDVEKLRKIFIFEFVLYPKFSDEDFKQVLNTLISMNILVVTHDTVHLGENSALVNVLLSAISPFLNSFLNTSKVILNTFCQKTFSEKQAFVAVQSFLEDEILKGNTFIHPYSLCLEVVTTTLLSLCNNGCLLKEKK